MLPLPLKFSNIFYVCTTESFRSKTSFFLWGVVYRIKISCFPNRGMGRLTARSRVIFILEDGFYACFRKHLPKAVGRTKRKETEVHRNYFSTSLAFPELFQKKTEKAAASFTISLAGLQNRVAGCRFSNGVTFGLSFVLN